MALLRSWVESANHANCLFPLNNLPYGVFSLGEEDNARCCVAIGEVILDVAELEAAGLLDLAGGPYFDVPFWNELIEAGPEIWAKLRQNLTALLMEGAPDHEKLIRYLVPKNAACLYMPFLVSEYTDFYAGKHHALNVGTMFRGPENALPPNWLHIPIGYNGRASSVVV